jgi:tetratricopeptide (TPR) repeat protein
MLSLPQVTLCCVDTANHALALRALDRSRSAIAFARTLFLTNALPPSLPVPSGIEVVPVPAITSRDAYSDFVHKSLLPHVRTSHMLLVQWDGYVVNPLAWDPAFLECDYIGAKWFWYDDGLRVGNGGFSLRSLRLLEALQDPAIVRVENEDTTIGRTYRPLLEREHGIRFATEELADRFSFEVAYPIGKPFGFHGLFNFCRTESPDEVVALCRDFSDGIARSPQLLQLMRNYVALGKWQTAIAIGRRILAAAPDAAEVRSMLGNAERRAATAPAAGRNDPCPCGSGRRFKQCHGSLSAPTGTAPTERSVHAPATPAGFAAPNADALARAALDMHRDGRIDEAERSYRAALAGSPDHPLAMHYLGVVLYQRNRIAEALPLLRRAAALRPQEPEFHNNLGLALAAADAHDDAIAAFRQALGLKPAHVGAWNNLGLALHAAMRLPEAIAAFREATARQPDFPQAHWNLSLALLAHGEFREGWREYEWRRAIPQLSGGERTYAGPRWDGAVRAGMTLLVTAEQGLGDMIQFVRLLDPLARRGITVLLSAPAPLVSLLATAPGVARVFGPDDPLPPYDAHVPLLALAGLLDVDAATIPAAVPYLAADARRRAEVAEALAPHAGRPKIGLAWQGSRHNYNERRRSVPLAELSPLLRMPGIAWFSLQRDEDETDAANVSDSRALVRLSARNDFDGTAALVAELDLVVSVDTSLAHLAGALAKPTWILLPFSSDWRWGFGRSDSPWYPTARLFRQPRPAAWEAVVRDVIATLEQMAG